MTQTTTGNDGADALLQWAYSESGVTQADARLIEANLNAALAAARREVVERLRPRFRESTWTDDYKNEVVAWVDIEFLLDEEAAR